MNDAASSAVIDELRRRLAEAEDTLLAIQQGSVDALVVENSNDSQIFTIESETGYRAFMEAMQLGAAAVDLDGNIIYANRNFATIFTDQGDDLQGRPLAHVIDEQELFERLVGTVGTGLAAPEIILSVDGAERHYVTAVTEMVVGTTPGYAVTFSDVTKERLAQRALNARVRELKCLYRVLELTTNDGMTFSQICQAIVAVLSEELSSNQCACSRLVINDTEYRSECWVEPVSRFSAAINNENIAVGFVELGYGNGELSQFPFSEFVREEEHLLNAVAAHVSRMIAVASARERLTRSDRLRAVGELSGGVAHDFNNLLTVILGNAETLAELLPDGVAKRLAEMTAKAAGKGAELTNQLLAFSRQQVLNPKAVDVRRLLLDMKEFLQRAIGEQIHVDVVAEADVGVALADQSQLENAILNLCLNARDAMLKGGLITVSASRAVLTASNLIDHGDIAPGTYILIKVEDNGAGMEQEVVARAFEPFFTTKSKGEGSGLGLSMVFGFAKQSNGTAQLVSEVGKGTTASIFLPAYADTDSGQQSSTASDVRAQRGAEVILVVEDHDLVREHVTGLLHSLGYATLAATNGLEAMAIIRANDHVDLVFTDIIMPGGMSGEELAAEVLRLRPDMPIVLTSGYSETLVNQGKDGGCKHLLLKKPYKMRELANIIRQGLGSGS